MTHPTQAEIEAAARAIYEVLPNGGEGIRPTTAIGQDGRAIFERFRYDDPWEEAPDRHDVCREQACAALIAAAAVREEWRPIAEFTGEGKIVRWHKFHKCLLTVERVTDEMSAAVREVLGYEWVEATKTTAWPEAAFLPFFTPIPAPPKGHEHE